jgi:hypothetical protein
MSTIMIRDLPQSRELDHRAMSGVRGGYALRDVANLPGFAVKVEPTINVNQNIFQLQNIGVNVLNNNGVIGASLPFHLNLRPEQRAIANVVL